jgi:hypothetical protein
MYTKTAAKSGKKVAKMADFFAATFARGFPTNGETNFVNEQKNVARDFCSAEKLRTD